MDQQVDGRLRDWVAGILPKVPVSFEMPAGGAALRGVVVYLTDISSNPAPRGPKRPPLQIMLRFMLTTWSSDPEEAHGWLIRLMFAAMDQADFEVERDAVPVEMWQAFGIAPRPAFLLRVPLRQERPEPETKIVLHPLIIKHSVVRSLEGVVFGPGDYPLADALVELPSLNLTTRTDRSGRFRFPAVPAEPQVPGLRVLAKGREMFLNSQAVAADEEGGLVIHFNLED